MIGIHRADCGCAYCLRPTVRTLDRSPEERQRAMTSRVNEQLDELLSAAPDSWHGGREVTEPPKPFSFGCQHEHTTRYLSGTFCRDCARWVDDQPA